MQPRHEKVNAIRERQLPFAKTLHGTLPRSLGGREPTTVIGKLKDDAGEYAGVARIP